MSQLVVEKLPRIGMDFSIKVTAETGPDQPDACREKTDVTSSQLYKLFQLKVEAQHQQQPQQQPEPTDNHSSSSHPCPACPLVLGSARELSQHLRGHNTPRSASSSSSSSSSSASSISEEPGCDYACGVCHKVLSSASSLDRHVLVHSGERPFKCTKCEVAFTTNGNMNRHLRTAHLSPSRSYEDSEGSDDSEHHRPIKRIQEEYNNNNIQASKLRASPELKRKCPDYADEPDSQRRHKILLSNTRSEIRGGYSEPPSSGTSALGIFCCTLCGKREFASEAQLDAHLERSHVEVPPRCDICQQSFKNIRQFNMHRFSLHFSEYAAAAAAIAMQQQQQQQRGLLRNSVVGFNDLTFVDFSSDKFPAIARAVCEQSLHRPASDESTPKYQCSKCLRAFPCRLALDAHESDCGSLGSGHAEQQRRDSSSRDDFFAGLDLQNKAALAEAKEGKDLADIQSIISVTSGPILQSFSRSDASTPDNCKIGKQSFGSSGSSGTTGSSAEYHEEEAQDAFAAEFRKMKLKGEFPCRLCSAVFPNLRALKGHNRAHMGVGPGQPYPCNMCPYSHADKATLVRHLRTHNGDRPYECSLCNYAFTTKANCERHVRNRHGRMSRDEIKSVLIYHPSEDSTNDGSLDRSGSSPRAEARKSLVYDDLPTQLHYPDIRIKDEAKLRQPPPSLLEASHYKSGELFSRPVPKLEQLAYGRHEELEVSRKEEDELDDSRYDSEDSVSLVSEAAKEPRLQASPMDLKKPSNGEQSVNADAPLDLSMDVLDLSKKAAAAAAAAAAVKQTSSEAAAEDLSRGKELYNTTNQLLLTQALLKAGQPAASSLESFYANAHMLYRNFGSFPGAGILQPYLFGSHLFGQDFAMKDRLQKELVRGLQTSGGSLVDPNTTTSSSSVATPGYGAPAFPQSRPPTVQNHTVNDQNDYASLMSSSSAKLLGKSMPTRDKLADSQNSSSVKMVIKNGVLMPKQKQRRYRTERPFGCEHCTARFTLRSNMERHIKQQHPQHWSQRPRGGHSTRGRPPANPPTLLQNLGQSSATGSHLRQMNHSYPSLLPKLGQSLAPSADYAGKHAISDQVKYAILAQQLKGNKPEENDSDEELIIDEENERATKEPTERTLSLLRGKLEANIESKCSDDAARRETSDAPSDKIKSEADDLPAENELMVKEDDDAREENTAAANDLMKMEVKEERSNESEDLASVSEILDNASQNYQQQFQSQYMSDEEGLVASTSNQSGSDEKSDSVNSGNSGHSSISKRRRKIKKKKMKKKSAYSTAPNRVICPYCQRPFPWTSSLRRHILTHTGQKPFRCLHCNLLFTTKSNCDRHLLRKHKNSLSAIKLRRTRSTSSPEISLEPEPQPQPQQPVPVPVNNLNDTATSNNQFIVKNVPERPFKCNLCPSSTFSTIGNLRKHKATKHPHLGIKCSRPESPASEPQSSPQPQPSPPELPQEEPVQETVPEVPQQPQPQLSNNDQSGYDSQSSGVSEPLETKISEGSSANNTSSSANETSRSRRTSPRSSPGPNVEAPFKCHLCDSGFSERNDCLEHIKDNHESSYEMLVAKGALDMEIDPDEPMPPAPPPRLPSDGEERRGRFPDYSNRKVVCAFCMRRFWSAEDLRRHMRTHTGERPFSCDICCRRFTLKHSMLRHRKKHESVDSSMYVGTSGDEDTGAAAAPQPPTIAPRNQPPTSTSRGASSLPQVASVATADAAPSGLMRFNPYEKFTTLTGRLTAGVSPSLAEDNTDNDLISNLLGIRDKSIIDRVLQASSADDAAKLLGVKGNSE